MNSYLEKFSRYCVAIRSMLRSVLRDASVEVLKNEKLFLVPSIEESVSDYAV